MTTSYTFDSTIAVSKKEFKLIHKNMKILMKKIESFINESLNNTCWDSKATRPKIVVDLSTFKQAWGTVKIGKCPVYAIIHITPTDWDTYLALEVYIATQIKAFSIKYHFNRINDTILNGNKPIGKHKDRFRAVNSLVYPWFGIFMRGKTDPTNNNFRIIVKSENVFCDENTMIYYSSRKEEEENNG